MDGVQRDHRQGTFTAEKARAIGQSIVIDWTGSRFDVKQFRTGLDAELEHGRHDPATNVSDDDELVTGKAAWAHVNEFPDYYTRLEKMKPTSSGTGLSKSGRVASLHHRSAGDWDAAAFVQGWCLSSQHHEGLLTPRLGVSCIVGRSS